MSDGAFGPRTNRLALRNDRALECVFEPVAARVNRALLVVAMIAAPVSVAAEPAFGWRAPLKCPGIDDVRARVERRLGGAIEGAVRGVEIEITRDGNHFVAQIDARALTVANDVRTLRSARCDELADAVAVVIARLASDVRAAEPKPHAAPPKQEAAFIADTRGPDETVRRDAVLEKAPPLRHTWGGGMRLLALSGIGALPRINLGGELAGYVRYKRHILELAVGRWVPQSARLDPGAPARVDVGLDVVTLRGGWGPEELPIRAWLSGELGSMSGEGMSVVDPRTESGRWVAVGGGFGVAWPMTEHARLVGTFELAIPLFRTTFMLQNGADLYQPAPAAARCALGLEFGWR